MSNDVADHLIDAARQCVAPIWTSGGILQPPAEVSCSGTCVFVETGAGRVILTANHVLEHFRNAKIKDVGAGLAVNLGFGVTAFIEAPRVIDEDKSLDLAVIDWPHLMQFPGNSKRYFPIATWSIPRPKRGDAVTVVGFPGAFREVTEHVGSFSLLRIGMVVSNDPGRNVWLVDEDKTLRTEIDGRIVDRKPDLGGISGSPGFFLRDGRFHLAGLVYECNPDGTMIALSSATVLSPLGMIDRGTGSP